MQQPLLFSLLIALSWGACTQQTSVAESLKCAQISLPCEEVDSLSVIGTSDEARRYLGVMQRAAGDFQKHFKEAPVPTAVIMSSELTPAVQTELERAGFIKILPWLDFQAKRALEQQAITEQLAEQIKHLPEAAQKQAMESLKAQLGAAPPELSIEKENGALAHELGHLWFIAQFPDPSGESEKNHSYGGWAPDWLDESAAVLMENAALKDQRRENFKGLEKEKLIPLETFFTMEHPLAQAASNLVKDQKGSDGPKVVFLTGDDADKFLKDAGKDYAGNFYLQVSAFVAFMIEHTQDPAIFTAVATHLSNGESFSNWVETSGHFTDLADLDKAWKIWIDQL